VSDEGRRLQTDGDSQINTSQCPNQLWGVGERERGGGAADNQPRTNQRKNLATEQCICDTNGIKQVGDLKEGDLSAVCGFYLRRYSRGQTLRLTSWTLLLLLFLLLLGAPKVPKVALACRNHSIPIAYKDMDARSHEQW